MARYGINISIDLEKIDKERIKLAKNGKKYLNVQSFIDTEPGEFGDHGFITQQKLEHEPKDLKLPICGNVRIFWQEGGNQAPPAREEQVDFESDIPF